MFDTLCSPKPVCFPCLSDQPIRNTDSEPCLELGDHATRLHDECGRAAGTAGLRLLVAVGGAPARVLADAAIDAGMPESAVRYYDASQTAADAVPGMLRDGDLVLVKGSRGTRTDLVADRIAAELA